MVRDAWVRAAPAGGTSAAYLSMTNGRLAADSLVGVSAPDVTDRAEPPPDVHRCVGMTGMTHTRVARDPGRRHSRPRARRLHVMLMDLKHDLKAGDRVTLILAFEQAGVITVDAEVRAD